MLLDHEHWRISMPQIQFLAQFLIERLLDYVAQTEVIRAIYALVTLHRFVVVFC